MKIPFPHAAPHHLGGPLRFLLPAVLVLLFLAVLLWLPWQAREMESNERQEQLIADTLWVEQAVRFELSRNEDALATLRQRTGGRSAGRHGAGALRPDAQQRPRTAARALARRRTASHCSNAAPKRRRGALPAPSRNAWELARATRKGRYSEPYQASAGGRGAGRLPPAAVSRRRLRRQPGRHLRPENPARRNGALVVRPGQRHLADRPRRQGAGQARRRRPGPRRLHPQAPARPARRDDGAGHRQRQGRRRGCCRTCWSARSSRSRSACWPAWPRCGATSRAGWPPKARCASRWRFAPRWKIRW